MSLINTRRKLVAAAGLAFYISGVVWAQQPKAFKVGEADLIPQVKIGYVANSNAYLNETDETSSNGLRVSPAFSLIADKKLLRLELGYIGDFASMSEDSLSYDDHRVFGSIDAELNSKNRASAGFELAKKHEELGKGRTFGQAAEGVDAVEFFESELTGRYTFGAPSARGNLSAGLLIKNTSYSNRSDLTEGADSLELTPYGQFSYRLSSKTRALLEVRYRSLNFESSSADRAEIQALAGLGLNDGGKTSGEIKIGVGAADYSDATIADTSFLVANVNVGYTPTNKASFVFAYQRQLDDVDRVGITATQSQTLKDTARVSWMQNWNPFITSAAFIRLEIQNRDCPAADQDTTGAGFDLAYNLRHWLQLGVGVAHETRSTSVCAEVVAVDTGDYERQVISLFAKISL